MMMASEMTIVQLLCEAQDRLVALRSEAGHGDVAREASVAITAVEDAIMRTNRAFAMRSGRFHIADVESLEG